MKQIKYLFASLALLTVSMAQAQNTPEAIIGQCPAFPSAKTLGAAKAYINEAASEAVDAFIKKIDELDARNSKNGQAGVSEDELHGALQQAVTDQKKKAEEMTGHSVEEIQNMSDAEQQAVFQKTAEKQIASIEKQMAATGFGDISLQDMANMSEEQLMAKMATSMGLTPAEMEALSKMSDKEAEAYMRKGDRLQRVQNSKMGKAAEQYQSAQPSQPEISVADIEAVQKAPEELQKFIQKVDDLAKLNNSEEKALMQKFAEIHAKHFGTANYRNAATICNEEKSVYTYEQQQAACKTVQSTQASCYAECFTLWQNQLTTEMGRIKAMLPEARRVDDLQSKATAAQNRLNPNAMAGVTQKFANVGMNALSVVAQYLETAKRVVDYPVEVETNSGFMGFDGK
jgi:hypothetical protein